MKPLTPTVTGRAVTSSWKVTAGCVTQGRRTSCQLIKLGEFWTRLVYFYPSCCECDYFLLYFNDRPDYFVSLFFTVRRRPQVDIKEYNFLERIFSKTKPEERTWAKLVNLNTVHWYCDRPEPTPAAIKYEERTRQRKSVNTHIQFDCFLQTYPSFFSEMEDAKRRAVIRNLVAKRKETD